jgi:effector-binding domain-containing protein
MGMMYTRAKKLKMRGKPFEYYWNSPLETPENELKTSIYFPVEKKEV